MNDDKPTFLDSVYPELSRFPDPKERSEALIASHESAMAAVPLLVLALVFLVAGDIKDHVRMILGWAGVEASNTTVKLLAITLFTSLLVMGFAGIVYMTVGRARKNLRRMLVKRGIAVCIPCGYDLRGIEDARCPECGRATVLADPGDEEQT